jgi:hypothetical protein
MKRRILSFLIGSMTALMPSFAQDRSSFDEFRKNMLNDYHQFRNTVLQDYDKYLDGIWEEYQTFRGEVRQSTPKPVSVPTSEPEGENVPTLLPAPKMLPEQQPTLPTPQVSPVQPIVTSNPILPSASKCDISFFSLTVPLPEADLVLTDLTSKSYGQMWRLAQQSNLQRTVLPALRAQFEAWQLNDWFAFELVRAYTAQQFSNATPKVRVLLECYLLSYLGYDIRLAEDSNGSPLLLVNLQQKIYARSFLHIGNATYYVFSDERNEQNPMRNCSLRTCQLPSDESLGKPLDLIIHQEIHIPFAAHPYSFSYGGLHIQGELNENLMPMLYRYPQMDICGYAASTIDTQLRGEIVSQLKVQLQDVAQETAVNELVQFVQSAFKYATDEEQHGFEKPYFFEEMLYYPQCDCEDRAIFFSDLLWQVLHVENQIINYPGHESVAVHLNTEINGDGYVYNSKRYYISDPTYIGSRTGMCMPCYKRTMPTVDYHWH